MRESRNAENCNKANIRRSERVKEKSMNHASTDLIRYEVRDKSRAKRFRTRSRFPVGMIHAVWGVTLLVVFLTSRLTVR